MPQRYEADHQEQAVLETESSFQEMLKVRAAIAQRFLGKHERTTLAFLHLWDVSGIRHGSPKREQR